MWFTRVCLIALSALYLGAAPAGVLINAGRSALWASADADYAAAAAAAVRTMRDRINAARPR